MRRKLFNLGAAISCVPCLATVVLWIRGNRELEAIYTEKGTPVVLATGHGEAVFYYRSNHSKDRIEWAVLRGGRAYYASQMIETRISPGVPESWSAEAFGALVDIERYGPPRNQTIIAFIVPWWMIFVLTASVPFAYLVRRIVRRRPIGCCSKCGYDLRATPDRCPECGTCAGPRESETAERAQSGPRL